MRLRRTAAVTAALLTLALSSCGDDASSSSEDGPDTTTTEPAEDPADGTDGGSTDGGSTDAGSGDMSTDLDTIGGAVESVMDTVQGYSVDGTTLTIDLDGTVADVSSDCAIIGTAAGAFELPAGSEIVLSYPDGNEPCEPL